MMYSDIERNRLLFLICSFIICFCIGLPTFLLGCNKNVSNVCIAYDIYNGQVYGYDYVERTCSSCTRRQDNKCKSYTYYTCYDAFVLTSKYDIYEQNQTDTSNILGCKLQTANGVRSKSSAQESTNSYGIGEIVNWYKTKGTTTCYTSGSVLDKWYVGVVFLSFSGLILLLLLCYAIYKYTQNANFTTLPTFELK